MASFIVKLNFNDTVNNYDFPLVFSISDPKEGIKATIIEGTRGDGSLIIPGGKKSQEITIKGNLFNETGYEALTADIIDMKTKVTTNVATLTLKHWTGATWVQDWAYVVRRIDEIDFSESLRTEAQEYTLKFHVISY